MDARLQLDQLTCMRGRRVVFRGVSCDVRPGTLMHVQGGNGSGKTSLLRMVCGLLTPHDGQVRWRGRPVTQSREALSRELVYLGHSVALKEDLSAAENLKASLALTGRSASAADQARALSEAGLQGRERWPIRLMSQGQRQRAALARLALSRQAPLWVLDEPFNALDASATVWLAGLLRAHVERNGLVLVTSHQPLPVDGLVTGVFTL